MFHNFSHARFSKFNFSVILLKRVPVVSFKFFPCGVCANQNEQAAQRRWHCCDLSWWVILVPLSALPLNCTSVWGCNQTIANAHNEKVRWRGCDPRCGSTLMCACFLFSSTCLVVLTDTPLRPCWLKCCVHWEEKPIQYMGADIKSQYNTVSFRTVFKAKCWLFRATSSLTLPCICNETRKEIANGTKFR